MLVQSPDGSLHWSIVAVKCCMLCCHTTTTCTQTASIASPARQGCRYRTCHAVLYLAVGRQSRVFRLGRPPMVHQQYVAGLPAALHTTFTSNSELWAPACQPSSAHSVGAVCANQINPSDVDLHQLLELNTMIQSREHWSSVSGAEQS